MHMKSALKSTHLRLFGANCRSGRQFDAEFVRSRLMGGRSPVGPLVAEGKAFDDRDPPVRHSVDFDRMAASPLEAIVATARGRARACAQCR
jgi:hypothetical protein